MFSNPSKQEQINRLKDRVHELEFKVWHLGKDMDALKLKYRNMQEQEEEQQDREDKVIIAGREYVPKEKVEELEEDKEMLWDLVEKYTDRYWETEEDREDLVEEMQEWCDVQKERWQPSSNLGDNAFRQGVRSAYGWMKDHLKHIREKGNDCDCPR
jgi:sirohydrochlorin ferrochelatase